MNEVPANPYIYNEAGTVIGHYASESLPGGRGRYHIGFRFIETWAGRDFSAEVVGFESRGTNLHHRAIIRYWH